MVEEKKKVTKTKKAKRFNLFALSFPEGYSLEKDGYSQSLMCAFCMCRMRWLLALSGYRSTDKIKTFHFGNIVHHVNEKMYMMKKPSRKIIDKLIFDYMAEHQDYLRLGDFQKIETDTELARCIMHAYIGHYKDDWKKMPFKESEGEFDIKVKGVRRRGKLDQVFEIKSGLWQLETKTKSRIEEGNLQKRLAMDPQNLFYLIGAEEKYKKDFKGTLYNIIRKPQIKQRKTESLKDFIDRLEQDIKDRPDFYFIRYQIPYTKTDKRRMKEQLTIVERQMKEAIKNGEVYQNRYACDTPFPCSYLDICSTGKLDGFINDGEIFPELAKKGK